MGDELLTNWAGNVTFSTRDVERPTSIDAVAAVVSAATVAGRRVKALGSRHSFNLVADTDGVLIDTRSLDGVEIDPGTGAAWVGAGVTFSELCPRLNAAGRAIHNLPSLPHITVVGAVSTATHGSGDRNRCLADTVEAVELVTADGELRTFERGHADFRGAVVSLGALGIVTRLRLSTEPAFDVAQTVYRDLPIPTAVAHLDEIMATAYSVSMFTDWSSGAIDQIWVKRRLDRDPMPPWDMFGADRSPVACHPLPAGPTSACTEQIGRPGSWHERLTHFRADAVPSAGEEIQSEYFVDRVDGAAAMEAVASIGGRFTDLLLVSEIRSVAADDQWMSTTSDSAKLAFHFTWRRDQPAVEALLAAVEAALAPFHPRPHWGKLSTLAADSVRSRFAHIGDFRSLADRLDPDHTFRNPMLDALVG